MSGIITTLPLAILLKGEGVLDNPESDREKGDLVLKRLRTSVAVEPHPQLAYISVLN